MGHAKIGFLLFYNYAILTGVHKRGEVLVGVRDCRELAMKED